MPLLEDPPSWLVVVGAAATVGLVVTFWRARASLADLERRGHPSRPVTDSSQPSGPRTRVREWIDPNATGRDDGDPTRS